MPAGLGMERAAPAEARAAPDPWTEQGAPRMGEPCKGKDRAIPLPGRYQHRGHHLGGHHPATKKAPEPGRIGPAVCAGSRGMLRGAPGGECMWGALPSAPPGALGSPLAWGYKWCWEAGCDASITPQGIRQPEKPAEPREGAGMVQGRDPGPAPRFKHPGSVFPGTDFSPAAGSGSRTGSGGEFR